MWPSPLAEPELPEPYWGQHKIVEHRQSPDGKFDIVRNADGRPGVIPHAFVFDGYGFKGNGPSIMDTHDIRGDISNSEGMDAPNIWFNNTDAGQSF